MTSFVIGRVALALLLMIGFYLLALSIAFALLWIPYAEFVFAEHITPKLAIICILGGLTILWSVLPRWDRFRAPGPLLTREIVQGTGTRRWCDQASHARRSLLGAGC